MEKNLSGKKGEAKYIICSIIFWLLGSISSGEKGRETEILGKKIKIRKKRGWGRIKSCRELYTPLNTRTSLSSLWCLSPGARESDGTCIQDLELSSVTDSVKHRYKLSSRNADPGIFAFCIRIQIRI